MPDSDVILREDRTDIVGRVGVTTDDDAPPSISLDPSEERLRFGGQDSDDATEIGPELIRSTRLRSEELSLGGGREFRNEGRIRVNRGGDQDLQPLPGVDISGGGTTQSDGWPAEIVVFDDGDRSITVRPDRITMSGGELSGPDHIASRSSLRVGGATSTGPSRELSKDGGSQSSGEYEYNAGELTVAGDSGTDDEATTTASIRGAPSDRAGASAALFHEDGLQTVDLDGGSATVTLGGHRGDGVTSVISGENGTVTLADGAGSFYYVTADAGTISIGSVGSGPLLEIDDRNQTIRTKYDIEQGVL